MHSLFVGSGEQQMTEIKDQRNIVAYTPYYIAVRPWKPTVGVDGSEWVDLL